MNSGKFFCTAIILVSASVSFSQTVFNSSAASFNIPNFKFYSFRPTRQLTQSEALNWVKSLEQKGANSAAFTLKPDVFLDCSTAGSKRLSAILKQKDAYSRNAAIAEIAWRKETRFKPDLLKLSIAGDIHAYSALKSLAPGKEIVSRIFNATKLSSPIKDAAALDLLRVGDLRGVSTVRNALANHRSLGVETGAGWIGDAETLFLLVKFADGSDRTAIRRDLVAASNNIRTYFPHLASLRRSAVDSELLRFTQSKDHAYRKWVAVAAAKRPDSKGFANALKILSNDESKDVRSTALWALGKGPRPANLDRGPIPST